ncbi:hypothetical protein D3C80_1479020 [compost metagenome]
MDLVDEQDVARLQIGQDRRQIPRLGQDRPRGGAKAHAQFPRHDLRQRRLAQPRRSEQQDVIQRLRAPARRVDEDLQIALGRRLTDELAQRLRPQGAIVLLARLGVASHQTVSHTPPLIPAEAGTQV